MKISRIGELGLIERIKKSLSPSRIGSDCALIEIGGISHVATCDILIEDKHFLRSYLPEKVGFKSISVNVSDIVAAGGIPKFALISIMLPDIDVSYVDGLYKGIMRACRFYGCQIVGGNIAASEKIGIDVFMIGETKKFISREKAKVGDTIFVTGTLGDSKAGLELIMRKTAKPEGFEKILIEKHLNPDVDLAVSRYLVRHATSAMDVSDGLSSDIFRLFPKSGKKIIIDAGSIPLSKELKMFCRKYKYDPIAYALSGGEDYRILFTQSNKKAPYIKIGTVDKGKGFFIDNIRIKNTSFDHFM